MRNLGIVLSALVTIILVLYYVNPFIIYLIGCYQIGTWVGDIMVKLMEKDN
jgi:hypothetical protein